MHSFQSILKAWVYAGIVARLAVVVAVLVVVVSLLLGGGSVGFEVSFGGDL